MILILERYFFGRNFSRIDKVTTLVYVNCRSNRISWQNIGVGLLPVMLYRGNRSNSRAEWNETLEGDLTKYILNQISL